MYVSVTVGAQALPTIIKMATIMKEKKNEWSQQDELPVNINILYFYVYIYFLTHNYMKYNQILKNIY